jgi:LysR family transcriptional regulator, glycine cleavage system transcriptional activator
LALAPVELVLIQHPALGQSTLANTPMDSKKSGKHLPPLGALRAFDAASRHLSFVRAAEELSVTPAAVSHQIKQLEHWLGLKLFDRSARGVALSRAGQDYANSVREIFDRLINTSAAARAQRSRRVVHVRAQFSIATVFLLPHVLSFNLANTDVEIQLSALNFDRNPAKGGADIAIYHQRPDVEGHVQQVLVGGHYKLFGAPALLARCDISTPAKFLAAPLLHTRPQVTPGATWRVPGLRDWLLQAGAAAPEHLPGMVFNLEHMTTAACVQGAGFALLLDELCMDSARAGSLLALPGPALPNPCPYTLMQKRVAKDEVRFVSDWLMQHARP